MKNQITRTQKWVQNTLAVILLLMISFSSFAQNPGPGNPTGGWPWGHHHGGNPGPPPPPHPPGPPYPGPGLPHPSLTCNAHFFHHRDSVVNGVRFFNLRGTGAATFAWNFGDGSTSTQSNPTHTYADSGLYIVCLTITDTIHGGCSDTKCDSIHVFTPAPRCNAHFRARPDSVANEVRFLTYRRGTFHQNATSTYSWDFGDGVGSSTSPHPTYAYATAGTYYVCLTVSRTNAGGSCTSTYCDSVNTNFPHFPGHHHHLKLAGESLKTTGSGILEASDVLVSVYPNPMIENSTIHIENTSGNVTFRLYNMTGQVAFTKEFGNGDFTINKDNLSEGLYFYTIEDGSTNIAKGKLQVN